MLSNEYGKPLAFQRWTAQWPAVPVRELALGFGMMAAWDNHVRA